MRTEINNVTEIPVRFSEQDEMGLVHHSAYYIWFEIARFNFAASVLNITYETLKHCGFFVPIIQCQCRYFLPVRFPNRVRVWVYYEASSRAIITLHYIVRNIDDSLIHAYGKTVNAFTSHEGKMCVNTPVAFRDGLHSAGNNEKIVWKPEMLPANRYKRT